MWMKFNQCRHALMRFFLILAGVVLISGCASTLSARVTSFQQWPAGSQGQTYRIVPYEKQVNNLEFQTIADMVRAAIGPVGLVEAQSDKARFSVHIRYENPASQTWVQQYPDPYLNDGWGFGPAFGWYGGARYWGGGIYYSPQPTNVPVVVYKNTLTVTINDDQNHNAEVYRSTAINVSRHDNLMQAMPYLAQAVFDEFPGNNGQVREVEYERRR